LRRGAAAAALAEGGRGGVAGRGACDGLPCALPAEVRGCGTGLRRDAGLPAPGRRLLPLAAGGRRRSGGAETVATDRRAGAARRLSVARGRGAEPRQGIYPGRPGGPTGRNAARADPAPRLPLRLRTAKNGILSGTAARPA